MRDSWPHFTVSNSRLPNVEGQAPVFTTNLQFESYVMTDGQSDSVSWNKAPIWGLRPDFYYCQTVAGLLMWCALSDERTGLPFRIAAGPRQRSHFRVRVLWVSSYFTDSDSRLPFYRLLRLAWLRWRYSTPPPHGINCSCFSCPPYNPFARTE
jgi:hypothetical protein